MKRLLTLTLALVMSLSLTACGGGGTSSSGSAPESGSSTSSEADGEKSFAGVKILHLISNTRGDGGNHDAAAAAVEKMAGIDGDYRGWKYSGDGCLWKKTCSDGL